MCFKLKFYKINADYVLTIAPLLGIVHFVVNTAMEAKADGTLSFEDAAFENISILYYIKKAVNLIMVPTPAMSLI